MDENKTEIETDEWSKYISWTFMWREYNEEQYNRLCGHERNTNTFTRKDLEQIGPPWSPSWLDPISKI